MKNKVLVCALCIFLTVSVLSGCGVKLQKSSGAPSNDAGGSPAGGAVSDKTAATGIVNTINANIITIDLVVQSDTQTPPASQIKIGSTAYVLAGGTLLITTTTDTAVMLESTGYIFGSLDNIAKGDFLAVVLRGSTAVTIIDAGPAGDGQASSGNAVPPSVSPTDTGASASPGVQDSGETKTYTVTTDNLKVRSGPGTTYSVLGNLDKGARETGTVSNGWLQFTRNGKPAYCNAQYLAVSTEPAGVPDSGDSKTYITTSNLLARSGPGTTYASLGTLDKGTTVTGTVSDGWLTFTYNDKTAYCSAAYLTTSG